MLHSVISFLLSLAVGCAVAQTGNRCPSVPGRVAETCVCEHPDGGIIDVTPLGDKDGPRYTDLKDPNDYTYSFNPCFTYSESGGCTNVHGCQFDKDDPTITYELADADSETMWIDTDGTPYLHYRSIGSEYRQVYAYLNCNPTMRKKDTFVDTTGDSDLLFVYRFFIHSCQVCPGGCAEEPGGIAAGEIGTILIIVALAGLATYFIVGAVIMKVKYQATGSDIIPNKAFWVTLPGLIKDGCGCTFGPPYRLIRNKIKGDRDGYETVK